jgi:hypothetical protein
MLKWLAAGLALIFVSPAALLAQSAAGGEFQVNSYTTGVQYGPAIASDASGNFVVVWASQGGHDGDESGVFGQRYNASGVPQGGEFQVNTYTTGYQTSPAVAVAPSGNFVVVWHSYGPDASGPAVVAQRYDALGTPQGAEFVVNTYTFSQQMRPSVASDASGNFVVVWESAFQDGPGGFGVIGRRFSAAGVPLGSEFQVNTYTTGFQWLPAVASDATGNFLVAWTSDALQDGSSSTVMAQRFDATGAPQGGEFRVNSYTTGFQGYPSAAADGSGHFVVVWASTNGQDGSYSGIFGQRIDAAGALEGPEFPVNTYLIGAQGRPKVGASRNGAFVVAWDSYSQDGFGLGVFARRFDAAGVAQGGEFQVNSYTTFGQLGPAISTTPDGDFVITWAADVQDGGSYGIFGQRYGDLIFQDGFESATLDRWSTVSADGGDLTVRAGAALGHSARGLRAVVNDTHPLFVQDETPNAENRYRARFYFNATSGNPPFDPGESEGHFRARLFLAQGGGVRLVTIVLKRQASAYSLEARVRTSSGARVDTGFFPVTAGEHHVEFDWQRATAPAANNGSFELWIDDVSVATLPGLDNDQFGVDQGRMGALSLKTGAGGTLFFDQFESRRERFIGAE